MWGLYVIVSVFGLALIGLLGLAIHDTIQWVQRIERIVRDYEYWKEKQCERMESIEKKVDGLKDSDTFYRNAVNERYAGIEKKLDNLKADIMETMKFSREVQTELYDTYDTLEKMINDSKNKREE